MQLIEQTLRVSDKRPTRSSPRADVFAGFDWCLVELILGHNVIRHNLGGGLHHISLVVFLLIFKLIEFP